MNSHPRSRSVLPDTEIAQRLKSVILTPVGTTTGVFETSSLVSLTFDDGPDPEVTPAVLDALAHHGARATFFVLTDYATARPELVRRILREGHEVGLHFDRHDRITDLPSLAAFRRLRESRDRLEALAGPIVWFRPPYGSQNYLTYAFARRLGLNVVGWSRCADDWIEQSAENAAQRALEQLRGGDIVLMHDGLELNAGEPRPTFNRAEAVDLFLRRASRRGLRSITVGALLSGRSPRRSHWFR